MRGGGLLHELDSEIYLARLPFNVSDGHWLSPLEMKNINITGNVLWVRSVDHQGECSVTCYLDQQCISFTFHKYQKVCQGHSKGHFDLNSVNFIPEMGSDYFMNG